jgi:N-acetylglucosamine kinase-like BadF-type ATPase
MEALLLGIDGGGSKTVALLADTRGRTLGRGTAGSCAFQALPEADVRRALGQAMAAAFAAAGLPPQPVEVIGLGLSGVDRPGDHTRVQRMFQAENWGKKIIVTNDSELLLWCGQLQGWGIGVVAGTGSIVFGCTPEGSTARAGGWGYRIGDEGSGFAIGTAALQAVAKAADGRGPDTLLTGLVLAHWGLQTPTDLIPHIYPGNLPYAQIARLAPLVSAAAGQGDPVAADILADAARELALAVTAVHRRLGFSDRTPAVFTGGVLLNSERVRSGLVEHLAAQDIQLSPLVLAEEPAQGAVRMALAGMP